MWGWWCFRRLSHACMTLRLMERRYKCEEFYNFHTTPYKEYIANFTSVIVACINFGGYSIKPHRRLITTSLCVCVCVCVCECVSVWLCVSLSGSLSLIVEYGSDTVLRWQSNCTNTQTMTNTPWHSSTQTHIHIKTNTQTHTNTHTDKMLTVCLPFVECEKCLMNQPDRRDEMKQPY